MKRKNLIKLLVDTIYRDNIYLITPIIDWDLMDIVNKHFRDNYNKVLPVLLKWQEKEYISLINDDNVIFIFYPEKKSPPMHHEFLSVSCGVSIPCLYKFRTKIHFKNQNSQNYLRIRTL